MGARLGNISIRVSVCSNSETLTSSILKRLGLETQENRSKYRILFGSNKLCDLYNKLEYSNVQTLLANGESPETIIFLVSNMMNSFLASVNDSKDLSHWISFYQRKQYMEDMERFATV